MREGTSGGAYVGTEKANLEQKCARVDLGITVVRDGVRSQANKHSVCQQAAQSIGEDHSTTHAIEMLLEALSKRETLGWRIRGPGRLGEQSDEALQQEHGDREPGGIEGIAELIQPLSGEEGVRHGVKR